MVPTRLTRAALAPFLAIALVVVGAAQAGAGGVAPSGDDAAVEGQQASGSLDFHMERLAGADRYATAAAVSRQLFTAPVPVAFVATGEDFPDGLSAGPAAHALGGPVLYVRRNAIPPTTMAELQRLQPSEIIVTGGPGVVSEGVRQQLDALAGVGARRVSGADRYGTSAALSSAFFTSGLPVYVATGAAFPDALTGGAAAARADGALLLVRPDAIPDPIRSELARLNPPRIVIFGGPGAVSTAVESELAAYSGEVVRRGGGDRYETAVAVSQASFPNGAATVFVATGLDFPDALAAVPAAGALDGPILLVRHTSVPGVVADEIARLGPQQIFVLGGGGAVADGVMKQFQRQLGVCWSGDKPPAGGIEVIDRVPGATNQVALTFDMGGRMEPAISIMEFLVANQVCATIFPTGIMSQTDEGRVVLDIIRAHPHLFEVGNHTMFHCNFRDGGGGSPTGEPCPATPPSEEFMRQSMLDARAIIEAGTHQPTVPYWRPTYGAYDTRVLQAVASVGYTKAFMWDIDTIDWLHPADGGPTAQEMANQVITQAQSGSNVLMHLGGWNTRDALPAMVDGLRDRGFTVTTLSEMLD